jgi:hypothetical protein
MRPAPTRTFNRTELADHGIRRQPAAEPMLHAMLRGVIFLATVAAPFVCALLAR